MVFQKGNKLGHKFTSERLKGVKLTEEHKNKIALTKIGSRNPQWKGDNVSYHSLHDYLRYHMTKPELCQFCNNKPAMDIANISGVYNRDLNNYRYLCRSCHTKYDIKMGMR